MNTAKQEGQEGFFARLHRDPENGWVAGVCAGLAAYFDWNVKLLRVITALALFFSGVFPVGVIYLALWYLMDPADGRPMRPEHSASPAPPASAAEVKARFARLERRLQDLEGCVSSSEFELRRELRKLES
jgi:phage shock protein C